MVIALVLMALGLATIITARDHVRYIIGAELLVLGAVAAAVAAGDINMAVAASAAGVAETVLLIAAAFRLRSHD
jgi:energy-converting hydrogenase Eha subunit C